MPLFQPVLGVFLPLFQPVLGVFLPLFQLLTDAKLVFLFRFCKEKAMFFQ